MIKTPCPVQQKISEVYHPLEEIILDLSGLNDHLPPPPPLLPKLIIIHPCSIFLPWKYLNTHPKMTSQEKIIFDKIIFHSSIPKRILI